MDNIQTTFRPNQEILSSFHKQGARIQKAGNFFVENWKRLSRKLNNGERLEPHETHELLNCYRTVQIYNRVLDPEQGRELAKEVKRWQLARVEFLRYAIQESRLLETTEAIDKTFREIHAWFGE